MTTLHSRIVGSTFHHNATQTISRMKFGTVLIMKREPKNPYDKNAISIWKGSTMLGYIPRGLAATLAPTLDAGVEASCSLRRAPNQWGSIEIVVDEHEF